AISGAAKISHNDRGGARLRRPRSVEVPAAPSLLAQRAVDEAEPVVRGRGRSTASGAGAGPTRFGWSHLTRPCAPTVRPPAGHLPLCEGEETSLLHRTAGGVARR